MADEIILNAEETNEEEITPIITLVDDSGEEMEFEILDFVDYEGKEYMVLIPNKEDACEIVILEVEPVDEETENYISVADEEIEAKVFEIFKERYKDILPFAE